MKGKFFIIGFFADLGYHSECFRANDSNFESLEECYHWIDSHKKYFSTAVRLGVFSVDNTF